MKDRERSEVSSCPGGTAVCARAKTLVCCDVILITLRMQTDPVERWLRRGSEGHVGWVLSSAIHKKCYILNKS